MVGKKQKINYQFSAWCITLYILHERDEEHSTLKLTSARVKTRRGIKID
jgi:hypothetical protein